MHTTKRNAILFIIMNIFEHKLIDGLKIDYEGSFEDFADEFEKIIGVRPQRVYPTSIPR